MEPPLIFTLLLEIWTPEPSPAPSMTLLLKSTQAKLNAVRGLRSAVVTLLLATVSLYATLLPAVFLLLTSIPLHVVEIVDDVTVPAESSSRIP